MASQGTSILFRINEFVLLEYIYETEIFTTDEVGFRRVTNDHTGVDTIVNDNDSRHITGNVVDDTVVKVDAAYALLDNDAAFFYPNKDDEVDVQDFNISPAIDVEYDRVRIHIMSGYNFSGFEGFIISLYLKMANNKQLRLCNLAQLQSDPSLLIFNPNPIKISEAIFDKFIEFRIPAQRFMLQDQKNNPNSTNTLAHILTDGVGIADQNTIYAEYKNIVRAEIEDGILFFDPGDTQRFGFNSVDEYNLLTAHIEEAEDGDYFRYSARWDDQSIEDFIFRLNSKAGNDFFIIHDIRILEQIGQTFEETDNITSIQRERFDKINRFRPILEFPHRATSFTIEYTVRLLNSVDGRSIFKISSLTSTDVKKYGPTTTKLNVGDTTQPLKVFNKTTKSPTFNITDNLLQLTKTKLLTTFVNSNNVVAQTDEDLDVTDRIVLKLTPFDNFLKFNVHRRTAGEGEEQESTLVPMEIGTVSDYFFVFLRDDQSNIRIKEFTDESLKKIEGELAFKIPKNIISDVQKIARNDFYVIARNPDGEETVFFSGEYVVGEQEAQEVQQ